MSGRSNAAASDMLRVTLSVQSMKLLDEIATMGIYGRNSAEVVSRFVDERLREFTEKPVLKIQKRKPK